MRTFIIFLSISLLALNGAQANGNSQVLKLGVEITNYSPYFYLDQEQHYQGAAREIFDLFTSQVNQPVKYIPMPVPRLFNEFVKGSVDLKFPDNPLWSASLKADVKVFYSHSVLTARESLMVMIDGDGKNTQQILDIEIQHVGTILGFSVPGITNELANKEFDKIETKKVEQLIHMLATGRIQAMYFNESVAEEISKTLYPNKRLIPHPKYPAFNYGYKLSSIKHPELITQFDKFLVSHAEQVTEIRNRYGLK